MTRQILFMALASIVGLGFVSQNLRAQEKQPSKTDSTQVTEKQVAKTDSVSLLDVKKVAGYLGLSKVQQDSIEPMIAEIQKIVDGDKKARDEMRAQFMSGQGQFSRESMQKARAERDERQKQIDALVAEIQKKLNDEQKAKFASVLIPNLQEIARAGRGPGRGRGGRRQQ